MTTKKYHTLIARDGSGERWGIEFGSFVRSEVEFERQDYRDHGRKASDLKIVTCDAGQAAIDAIVAAMNGAADVHAEVAADVTAASIKKLTAIEAQALRGILDSNYLDGAAPVDWPVWTWSANPFASKRTFSGAVSSLVRKGLAKVGGSGEEATIQITQAGFDAYTAAQAVAG